MAYRVEAIVKAQKTLTFRRTWMGRAGESTDYLATSDKIGPRVTVQRWTDTNEVTVRAITGDGWKGRKPFAEFAKVVLKAPTTPELEQAIAQCERALP